MVRPGRPWTNWSGSLSFTPAQVARPRSHEEVVELVGAVARDGRKLRPVGTGHSSSPLVATTDVLVSLEHLAGLVAHDTAAGLVTVLPGTGLSDLCNGLADVGLALENLGDVDYQSIAGAVATGTHGTGERLGNLSSALAGGTLVTGAGRTLAFGTAGDGDTELLRATQVSLGALGVMTSMTLRVRRAYQLHRRNWCTHVDWVLEHLDELAARHRHVDFYWYPRSDLAQLRVMDEPGEEGDLDAPGHLRADETGPAHTIIPNERDLRFDEMEYLLPRENGLETFREVRERVKERHRSSVGWRLLVRTVAPDEAMLSTAHRRPTMTIALLQNADLDHEAYFRDMEPLLLEHGGRPHWGKKHTRTAPDLRAMYPDLGAFTDIRRRLDPGDVLLTEYLRTLLEDES
ncbi:D-arabinono-1,4-lactone oxidase [Georgenia sp. M64]|uniref:D-arabinono-1,4-lactone oxidase n=1 Tax=Georgenia sp. M64 TaxID=3120520 RepID=UPI0030E5D053